MGWWGNTIHHNKCEIGRRNGYHLGPSLLGGKVITFNDFRVPSVGRVISKGLGGRRRRQAIAIAPCLFSLVKGLVSHGLEHIGGQGGGRVPTGQPHT